MTNINKNMNKSGFSLAESLISMMLIALTIILSMANITRKKHHSKADTSLSSISGMYACWNDGVTRNEFNCAGNHCDSSSTNNNGQPCEFKKDRRVKNYYIYAVGSRYCIGNGQCANGQVKISRLNSANTADDNQMKIKIILGKNNPAEGNTIVKDSSGGTITKAIGGIEVNSSKIVPGNMEDCKYILGAPYGSNAKCQVSSDKSIGIVLYGDQNNQAILDIDSLQGNGDIYTNGSIAVKIKEVDSSLKAEAKSTTESEFVKQLKMIPSARRNGLIDELLKYYQKDNGAKDGVVLIIW